MDPLTLGIAGGAIIGSAALQWLNSKDAQRASNAERDRIQQLYEKVNTPNFDPKDLTPEDYQVVGTYVPQVAPYVEAIAPQVVKADSQGAVQGRAAQEDALQNMLQMARNGKDPLSEIANARSGRSAASNSQSARATLDAQMQRRGVQPGSGLSYAGNQAAISDAFQADALAGEQSAADAAQRRMQATNQAANLGGQIYGQDVSLAEKNANTMNDFNKWVRGAQQDWQNQRAGTLNTAQQQNLGTAQNVSNANVGLANQFKGNRIANQEQKFQNDLAIANGKAGLSNNRVNDISQYAQQGNSAIGGIGQGIAQTAMYAGKKNNDEDKLTRN